VVRDFVGWGFIMGLGLITLQIAKRITVGLLALYSPQDRVVVVRHSNDSLALQSKGHRSRGKVHGWPSPHKRIGKLLGVSAGV
jgi:hypothetical protein